MDFIPNHQRLSQEGFTFIELMTVVAIIGIVASISLPIYQAYINKVQGRACLAEAKNYSNQVFVILNDINATTLPIAPVLHTCQSMTDAAGWTPTTQKSIVALAKTPSRARIECDIPNGNPCKILP